MLYIFDYIKKTGYKKKEKGQKPEQGPLGEYIVLLTLRQKGCTNGGPAWASLRVKVWVGKRLSSFKSLA